MLNGINNLDLINPKKRNIIDTVIDHNLNGESLRRGQTPNRKKTIKNSIPKLRTELFDFIDILRLNLFDASCQLYLFQQL